MYNIIGEYMCKLSPRLMYTKINKTY